MRLALPLMVCLAACSDPTLSFAPTAGVLLVGQRASVVVTEGGDGSDLDESTFTLSDSEGREYDAKSPDLELKRVSGDEVSFSIPPGIAAGQAALSVKTSEGPTFESKLTVNRLMAVRDLSGKIWLLALLGDGSAAQFSEAAAGTFGFGFGHVAVGNKGRLLASTARAKSEVRLAWLSSKLTPSPAHSFGSSVVITGVRVTGTGLTLVATESGTYAVEKPTAEPPGELTVSNTPLTTGKTVALAVDGSGARAVAMTDPGITDVVQLALLDLTVSPPALLQNLKTSWTGGSDARLSVAMSPDGKNILAVDGRANRLALFTEGNPSPVEAASPASEEGATAVAASTDGSLFYVVNATSKNVSRVQVSSGQITFGSPLSIGTTSDESGTPVDVAVSQNDEVAILLEHDIVLLYDKGTKAKTLGFPNLFKDKVGGEVGGGLAIQP
jgi:hypothetical protein